MIIFNTILYFVVLTLNLCFIKYLLKTKVMNSGDAEAFVMLSLFLWVNILIFVVLILCVLKDFICKKILRI